MFAILGYFLVILSVVLCFTLTGGKVEVLIQPLELLLIGGAAFGAFLATNSSKGVKNAGREIFGSFRRSPYDKALYIELMQLLSEILRKAQRDGLMSMENDVDQPQASPIFRKYPAVLGNTRAIEFLCDYLRLELTGNMSPLEIESLMDEEMDTYRHETRATSDSLQITADALPAFGIVAAVLGMIHALSAIDRPAAILGDLIAKAMVGTFLGILLAYGFVGPLSQITLRRADEKLKLIECIRATLLANLHGYAAPIAIEFGRKVLFSSIRPSFNELDKEMRAARSSNAS